MIVQATQGQCTGLPLNILMDPGSYHSFVHSSTIQAKGAIPKIIRPRVMTTLKGIPAFNQNMELQGTRSAAPKTSIEV